MATTWVERYADNGELTHYEEIDTDTGDLVAVSVSIDQQMDAYKRELSEKDKQLAERDAEIERLIRCAKEGKDKTISVELPGEKNNWSFVITAPASKSENEIAEYLEGVMRLHVETMKALAGGEG